MKKDHAPSSAASADAKTLDPGALMERARGIGGPPRGERLPSREEERVIWALCSSALRRGDAEKVERLVSEFGGLPSGGESESLLKQSAETEGAVAFEALSLAAWMKWEAALRRSAPARGALSEGEALKEFLKCGLINTPAEAKQALGSLASREDVPGGGRADKIAPVGAALGADNPVALAKALCLPGWREALAAREPRGIEEIDELSEAEQVQRAEAGQFAEGCLLSLAIKRGALRCALLLLSLPEFSQTLLRELLPCVEDGVFDQERRMASVLASMPSGFLGVKCKPSPEREFIGVWRSYSFFERLLKGYNLNAGKEDSLWPRVIEAAIEAQEVDRARPQKGSGRGWAEMIVCGVRNDEASLRLARGWIERLRDRGAAIDWERVSRVWAAEDSPAAMALSEWAALEGLRLSAVKGSKPKGI